MLSVVRRRSTAAANAAQLCALLANIIGFHSAKFGGGFSGLYAYRALAACLTPSELSLYTSSFKSFFVVLQSVHCYVFGKSSYILPLGSKVRLDWRPSVLTQGLPLVNRRAPIAGIETALGHDDHNGIVTDMKQPDLYRARYLASSRVWPSRFS